MSETFQMQCECGKVLSATYNDVAKQGQCPSCSATFIIPWPDDVKTRKLSCKCGLIMEYDVKDAGRVAQCPECAVQFKIPGKPVDKMGDELEREVKLRIQRIRSNSESRAAMQTKQTLDRIHRETIHETTLSPRADHESWGITGLVFTVVAILGGTILLGVLLIVSMKKLDFDLLASLGGSSGNESNEGGHSAANGVDPNHPIKVTKVVRLSSDGKAPMHFFRIGDTDPAVSVVYPKNIDAPFDQHPLTRSEARLLSEQFVTAVNNNSPQELALLFDCEVLGNHLFGHDSMLPAKSKMLYGAEAIAVFQAATSVSYWQGKMSAKAYVPMELNSQFVGIVATNQNIYHPPPTLVTFAREPDRSRPKSEMVNLSEQLDAHLKSIDASFPKRFDGSPDTMPHIVQPCPTVTLMDHQVCYFAIIGNRNRYGRLVIEDIWALNGESSLFEKTWDFIDADKNPKTFHTKRPQQSQTRKYLEDFKRIHGDDLLRRLMLQNIANRETGVFNVTSSNFAYYPEQEALKSFTNSALLGELNQLDDAFPDDVARLMVQSLLAKKLKKERQAGELFDRAVQNGASNPIFYQQWMREAAQDPTPDQARKVLEAFRRNGRY